MFARFQRSNLLHFIFFVGHRIRKITQAHHIQRLFCSLLFFCSFIITDIPTMILHDNILSNIGNQIIAVEW